jgi:AcrR family transcriptional regulator
MAEAMPEDLDGEVEADWHRRVVGRSLRSAKERSVDRGRSLIDAAVTVLERTDGGDITVQDVADEAGQSLRTLYQYFEGKDDLLLAVFEEAMRAYARLLRTAIEELDDPLDRLSGAIIAAVSMPEYSGTGLNRGLARLRLKLSESEPDQIGRAQAAVIGLVRELVEEAAAAKRITATDADAATFLLLSLNAAVITADTLGNDAGVRRPGVEAATTFCLLGLGAELEPGWFERVGTQVRLPAPAPTVDARPKMRAVKKRS